MKTTQEQRDELRRLADEAVVDGDSDMLFLTAANPTTILALLDRLAAMTERAELAERDRDARPNLDESDCAALLGALAGDVVQPDLGWFGRITDELAACRTRGSR